MKAIKIDVVNQTVTEVEIDSGIQAIYDQLDCTTFEVVPIKLKATLYVDEEGLYRSSKIGAFAIQGWPGPLLGHGLIMGTKRNGDSTDAPITVEEVQKLVRFLS